MTESELIARAMDMLPRAYAPYSGFHVGAALLSEDGGVFCGCNVENGSYGATMCAERGAVAAAVAAGRRRFVKLAVVSSGEKPCLPCGICRQVLGEFSPGLEVLCAGADGRYVRYPLSELLPHAFVL